MKAICTDEMKHIQLDILKNVAKFCDENRIRYYLGFGTMLGQYDIRALSLGMMI